VTKHPGNFFVLVPLPAPSTGQARESLPWQTTEKTGR
jgi:hypothetical protein